MSEREPIQDVNIAIGDYVSAKFYEASKQTYANRPGYLVELHQSFSGFRAIPGAVFTDVENLYFNLAFDGVGTKVEIAERMDDHSFVAHDLFAMVCDDAVVRGAEPIALGSIFDVNHLNDDDHTRNAIDQITQGYVEAAEAAGVIVVNGEVAELGDRIGGYGEFNYNWGSTVLWAAHKDRILTGHELNPGDALIGLREHGFRSNGITDVRKGMLETYGPDWHNVIVPELGQLSLGKLVQKPSIIYSKFVSSLTGGFDITKEPKANITGVAHITGGGQPSKLGRMLEPSGLGIVIDNPVLPPRIMLEAQRCRDFSDETAYGKWHMGPGMVIATSEPDKVLEEALKFGMDARQIGYVTGNHSDIVIKNKGGVREEKWLTFKV